MRIFPTTGVIGAISGDSFWVAYDLYPVKNEDFDLYKDPRLQVGLFKIAAEGSS